MTESLFAQTSATLVRSGLEDRMISVLRRNVEAHAPTAVTSKPGVLSGHLSVVLQEFGGQHGNMVCVCVCVCVCVLCVLCACV